MKKLSDHQMLVNGAKQTSNDLMLKIIPRISDSLGFNQYRAIENTDSESDLIADRQRGEDYHVWFNGIDGLILSTRLQYDCCYPTITIRAETSTGIATEQEKRFEQLSVSGSLSHKREQYYTLHGYISSDGNNIFKVYYVKTADIVDYLIAGGFTERKQNSQDGNVFIVVPVESLRLAKVNVEEVYFDSFEQYEKSVMRADLTKSIAKLKSRYI